MAQSRGSAISSMKKIREMSIRPPLLKAKHTNIDIWRRSLGYQFRSDYSCEIFRDHGKKFSKKIFDQNFQNSIFYQDF